MLYYNKHLILTAGKVRDTLWFTITMNRAPIR
jgi:hypothetical protein